MKATPRRCPETMSSAFGPPVSWQHAAHEIKTKPSVNKDDSFIKASGEQSNLPECLGSKESEEGRYVCGQTTLFVTGSYKAGRE